MIIFFLVSYLQFVFPQANNKITEYLQEIKDLKQMLSGRQLDSALYENYYELGNKIKYRNPDTALYFLNKSTYYAVKLQDPLKEANSIRKQGWCYYLKSNYDSALSYYEKAYTLLSDTVHIKQRQEADKLKSITLDNIGVLYWNKGDYENSLNYYFKALTIEEQTGYQKGQSNTLGNIGLVYYHQKNYKKALEYYHKALQIDEALHDTGGMAIHLGNIGLVYADSASHFPDDSIYIKNKLYDESLNYQYKALEINRKLNNTQGQAYRLGNIGNVYFNKQDYEKALKYYREALKIDEKLGNKNGIARHLGNIGITYQRKKQYKNAEKYLKQAIQLAHSIHNIDYLKAFYQALSEVYQESGNYKEALTSYQKYIEYRDSVMSERNQRAAIIQEMKYQYEKEQAIRETALKGKIALEKAAKEKQQIISYSIAGGLLLAGVFLVLVINRLQVTRKQKKIIELQKKKVEEQKRLVEEKNQEIIDSITYAQRIQKAILPNENQWYQLLPNSFILFKPKDIVSGDFYWLEQIEDDIYFAAADCTGHGVPGAMVSVICSNALSKALIEESIRDTGKLLDRTRELVIERFSKSGEEVKDGMDVSLCRYNPQKRTLQWSGAHNPLWILRNNEIIEYKANRQPIGNYPKKMPFTTHQIPLLPNDRIYIFSDGFQDQFGGSKQKKFKAKNLQKLLIKTQHLSTDEQKNAILEAFEKWKGELMQIDDVTLLCVQV